MVSPVPFTVEPTSLVPLARHRQGFGNARDGKAEPPGHAREILSIRLSLRSNLGLLRSPFMTKLTRISLLLSLRSATTRDSGTPRNLDPVPGRFGAADPSELQYQGVELLRCYPCVDVEIEKALYDIHRTLFLKVGLESRNIKTRT